MAVKIVKSVARVLEILELFSAEQKAMPAVEIANKLNYPLASTHEILKTLVELGYFSYGTPKWAFVPSGQFSDVLNWVQDAVMDDSIIRLMNALNITTRETINLSRRISSHVKIIQGYECLHEIGVSSKPGTVMPIAQSLTGITSLAHMNGDDLEKFWIELEKEDPLQFAKVNIEFINDILDEIKQCGTATRSDINIEGIGAICCPVISSNSSSHFVIGIVGPSERIQTNAKAHRDNLKRIIRQFGVKPRYKIS